MSNCPKCGAVSTAASSIERNCEHAVNGFCVGALIMCLNCNERFAYVRYKRRVNNEPMCDGRMQETGDCLR